MIFQILCLFVVNQVFAVDLSGFNTNFEYIFKNNNTEQQLKNNIPGFVIISHPIDNLFISPPLIPLFFSDPINEGCILVKSNNDLQVVGKKLIDSSRLNAHGNQDNTSFILIKYK